MHGGHRLPHTRVSHAESSLRGRASSAAFGDCCSDEEEQPLYELRQVLTGEDSISSIGLKRSFPRKSKRPRATSTAREVRKDSPVKRITLVCVPTIKTTRKQQAKIRISFRFSEPRSVFYYGNDILCG